MTLQTGLGAISFDTAFVTKRTALASEIDMMGHVNNAVYVTWLQDVAMAHWAVIAPDHLKNDFLWICLRHEIDYRDPVFEGDDVEVRTWVGDRKGAKFNRHVDIRKTGSDRWSVQAVTTWVMLSEKTKRPIRIGEELLSALGISSST